MIAVSDSPAVFALSTHGIDQVIFRVASVLEVPVLILALLALALVIFELGSYAVELRGRRTRQFNAISLGAERARAALLAGDRPGAAAAVSGVARSPAMAGTLAFIVEHARKDAGDHQVNKALADFDFDAQRRLGRTRMLVRAGPALGLMGTLIPLSPALTGLANGNTAALSENLRLAFSVTVVGLLIGAVAFGVSLSRDNMYGQDLSDLEYLAAVISDPRAPGRRDVISVTPRSRSREDRAGDPLDGLVNLFDLGIVLSVAFLLAALSSLHLAGTITKRGLHASAVYIKPGETVAPLPKPGERTIGRGIQVGTVYRLANGELVYVQQAPGPKSR